MAQSTNDTVPFCGTEPCSKARCSSGPHSICQY